MTPEEKEQRLATARRAVAGFSSMLATAVSTAEALRREGGLGEIIEAFEFHASALRLSVRLAEMELAKLERTP